METALWSLLVVVVGAALIGTWRVMGRLVNYAAGATADRVVDRMGDVLQVRWEASIEEALKPIEATIDAIDDELTLNGGDTVKDGIWELRGAVSDMQQQIEAVLTTHPHRKEPQ